MLLHITVIFDFHHNFFYFFTMIFNTSFNISIVFFTGGLKPQIITIFHQDLFKINIFEINITTSLMHILRHYIHLIAL